MDSLRSRTVKVRLTLEEGHHVAAAARSRALSVSSLLRHLGLGLPLPGPAAVRPIPEVNQRTYAELHRIGVNLNQIAQHLNEGRGDDRWKRHALDLLAELVLQIKTLRPLLLGAASDRAVPVESGQ